jgi:hypothetical protein
MQLLFERLCHARCPVDSAVRRPHATSQSFERVAAAHSESANANVACCNLDALHFACLLRAGMLSVACCVYALSSCSGVCCSGEAVYAVAKHAVGRVLCGACRRCCVVEIRTWCYFVCWMLRCIVSYAALHRIGCCVASCRMLRCVGAHTIEIKSFSK